MFRDLGRVAISKKTLYFKNNIRVWRSKVYGADENIGEIKIQWGVRLRKEKMLQRNGIKMPTSKTYQKYTERERERKEKKDAERVEKDAKYSFCRRNVHMIIIIHGSSHFTPSIRSSRGPSKQTESSRLRSFNMRMKETGLIPVRPRDTESGERRGRYGLLDGIQVGVSHLQLQKYVTGLMQNTPIVTRNGTFTLCNPCHLISHSIPISLTS
jgi:hypothetical protein